MSREDKNESPSLIGHRIFFLVILFFSLFLAYKILGTFIHTIVLAIILTAVVHPLKAPLMRLYGGRPNATALTAVFIMVFLIVIPVFFFLSALVTQGIDTLKQINQWIGEGHLQELLKDPRILQYRSWLETKPDLLGFIEGDLSGYLMQLSRSFGKTILSRGAGLLRDMIGLGFHFLMMIFISFYLFRDGGKMLERINELVPLPEDQKRRIVERIKAVGRSALLGNFLTAVCQGTAGGIALEIVGFPGLFWGALMGFSSFVPIVGTAAIWIPASLYLALQGRWQSAVFLSLWGVFLIGSIDNFIRPFLMRGEGRMSPFYIFLAIIGGIRVFGLPGILYGPIILGFASVMLYIYQTEY